MRHPFAVFYGYWRMPLKRSPKRPTSCCKEASLDKGLHPFLMERKTEPHYRKQSVACAVHVLYPLRRSTAPVRGWDGSIYHSDPAGFWDGAFSNFRCLQPLSYKEAQRQLTLNQGGGPLCANQPYSSCITLTHGACSRRTHELRGLCAMAHSFQRLLLNPCLGGERFLACAGKRIVLACANTCKSSLAPHCVHAWLSQQRRKQE